MTSTYLANVHETSHDLAIIPGDADGPYPWLRCHGRRCPHRLRDSRACVCGAAAWTHFLVVEPRARDTETILAAIQRGDARLRALSSGAPVTVAYTIHRGLVVVLVAAPASLRSAVYEAVDGYTDESGALDSGSSTWRMLDPDDLTRVVSTAPVLRLSQRERRRAAFAAARKMPPVTYIRPRGPRSDGDGHGY